jgi:squalene-associated FAD-dependent desaturase
MSRRIVVVGGGLAGIACALDCAQAGAEVTLVEVRRQLGGAAYSFERDGMSVDNGQHVFLRCCTAYRALLARLGSSASVHLQPRLEIPVLSPGCEPALLRRARWPAPFHLAGSLLRYRRLAPSQRLRVGRAALALSRADPRARELDEISFGDWLARHGQDRQTVAALWDLIALPSLNLRAAQASAALCAFVFKTGLLERADAGDIGFHERPLGETIDAPAQRTLAAAGVEVRLGWRAQRIDRLAGGFRVHRDDAGHELDAEAVVVAVPHARAASLVESLLAPTAAALRRVASSPIVNVHVVYDRPVCQWRFAAGVHTPVQYLFDRTAAAGLPREYQYLALSLSGAEREMSMTPDELRARYLPALSQLLPRARAAKVERFMVTKEHAATFRAQPGIARLRPGAHTDVPGLVLAGTWTDTGWPATLEGAVLSGHAAASAVLAGRPALTGELAGR